MKKLFFLFAITILFVSCQEDYYETKWEVVNLEVRSAQWTLDSDDDGLNKYFYSTFDMPEITPKVYDLGNVQVYYEADGIQQVLPYVRHYENSEGALWTRTVDYSFASGSLTIYVTNSDFFLETPPDMNFRVVIMW